jgi:hypothetical protein
MRKIFIALSLLFVMLATSVYATVVYNKDNITGFDFANIFLNGEQGL